MVGANIGRRVGIEVGCDVAVGLGVLVGLGVGDETAAAILKGSWNPARGVAAAEFKFDPDDGLETLFPKTAELTALNAVTGTAIKTSHSISIVSVAMRSLAPMLRPATQGPTSLRNVPRSLLRFGVVDRVSVVVTPATAVALVAITRPVCFCAGVAARSGTGCAGLGGMGCGGLGAMNCAVFGAIGWFGFGAMG